MENKKGQISIIASNAGFSDALAIYLISLIKLSRSHKESQAGANWSHSANKVRGKYPEACLMYLERLQ